MTGLSIQLKPHEKLLVNGVVLQNGDRRVRIWVRTKGATVLRMTDILHPVEAITPARHAYYLAQLAVIGAADAEETSRTILDRLPSLRAAYARPAADDALSACEKAIADGKLFSAMRALKRLFPFDGLPSDSCASAT